MRWVLVLLLTAPCLGQDKSRSDAVKDPALQKSINAAIERGAAYLRKSQEKSGCWRYFPGQKGDADNGVTALCLYALAASGVPADDPAVAAGVDWAFHHGKGYARGAVYGTYSASLLVLALARLDASKHAEGIRDLAARVAAGANRNGAWTYNLVPVRGGGDLSNSQFAILALWAARTKASARIPESVWRKVKGGLERSQHEGGGWDYGYNKKRAQPSMTAAGLFGFVVSCAALEGGLEEARRADRAQRGIKALLRKPMPYYNFYYCYGLERAAAVAGIPAELWYVEGARQLVRSQEKDGSWQAMKGAGGNLGSGIAAYNTSLALLFLTRATRFVVTPADRAGPISAPGAKFPEHVTERTLKRAFEAYLLADPEQRRAWTPRFGAAGPAAVALLVQRLGDPEELVRVAAHELLGALVEKRFLFDPKAEPRDREVMVRAIEAWFEREGGALRWDDKAGRFRE